MNSVKDITMLTLSNTILFMRVRARLLKESVERGKQSTHNRRQVLMGTIGSKDFDPSLNLGMDHRCEALIDLKYFRPHLEMIDPSILRVVINEAYIVTKAREGDNRSRSSYVRMNKDQTKHGKRSGGRKTAKQ